jgi:hypothetical protein
MKINLRITNNDESAVDTAATTADLVAFEDHFNRSVVNLEAELRLTDICWLAWHSQRRKDQTSLDFHPWLETIDGVELTDGEVEPVPLAPTASTSD